jgi:hypothetical protein
MLKRLQIFAPSPNIQCSRLPYRPASTPMHSRNALSSRYCCATFSLASSMAKLATASCQTKARVLADRLCDRAARNLCGDLISSRLTTFRVGDPSGRRSRPLLLCHVFLRGDRTVTIFVWDLFFPDLLDVFVLSTLSIERPYFLHGENRGGRSVSGNLPAWRQCAWHDLLSRFRRPAEPYSPFSRT